MEKFQHIKPRRAHANHIHTAILNPFHLISLECPLKSHLGLHSFILNVLYASQCFSISSVFDNMQLWMSHDLFNQPLIIEIICPFLFPHYNEKYYIEIANEQPHSQACI